MGAVDDVPGGGWKSNSAGDRDVLARIAGQPYAAVEKALIPCHVSTTRPLSGLAKSGKPRLRWNCSIFLRSGSPATSWTDICGNIHDFECGSPGLGVSARKPWRCRNLREDASAVCSYSSNLCGWPSQARRARLWKVPGLASLQLDGRVDRLVRDLLRDAGCLRAGSRWPRFLRPLAEAAPKEFLTAVERSLARSDRPIAALFPRMVTAITSGDLTTST